MDKFLLLFIVTFAGVAGIFLLNIILKKVFSIQITSPLRFTLWLVLSIILGLILYTCFTEGFSSFFSENTFREKVAFGRHRSPGSITAFIVLLLFWFIMLLSSFKKIKRSSKTKYLIPENERKQMDNSNQNPIEKN